MKEIKIDCEPLWVDLVPLLVDMVETDKQTVLKELNKLAKIGDMVRQAQKNKEKLVFDFSEGGNDDEESETETKLPFTKTEMKFFTKKEMKFLWHLLVVDLDSTMVDEKYDNFVREVGFKTKNSAHKFEHRLWKKIDNLKK